MSSMHHIDPTTSDLQAVSAESSGHISRRPAWLKSMTGALTLHWPEYLMEAAGLGLFLISACLFTALLEYPASPVRQALPLTAVRHALIGAAMGLTAIAIIYSPWGKQSGAHLNPAFTLMFYRLGKIASWDAAFYAAAQFLGGAAGVAFSVAVLGDVVASPSVNYAITVPGPWGPAVAFAGEFAISFGLALMVLIVTNRPVVAPYTGIFAGILIAVYIIFEGPVSGMSMNPARTAGSALLAGIWTSFWIYMTAPALAMLLAAEAYLRRMGPARVFCAKYHHQNDKRCIFCEFHSPNHKTSIITQ